MLEYNITTVTTKMIYEPIRFATELLYCRQQERQPLQTTYANVEGA